MGRRRRSPSELHQEQLNLNVMGASGRPMHLGWPVNLECLALGGNPVQTPDNGRRRQEETPVPDLFVLVGEHFAFAGFLEPAPIRNRITEGLRRVAVGVFQPEREGKHRDRLGEQRCQAHEPASAFVDSPGVSPSWPYNFTSLRAASWRVASGACTPPMAPESTAAAECTALRLRSPSG